MKRKSIGFRFRLVFLLLKSGVSKIDLCYNEFINGGTSMALARKAKNENDGEDGIYYDGKDPVFTGKSKTGEEILFSVNLEEADILLSDEALEKKHDFEAKISEEYTIHLDNE